MDNLLAEISKCRVCAPFLKDGVNPLIRAHPDNRILIIGQAPGIRVHESGHLWKDKSGDNLRQWLDVDDHTFYHSNTFGMIPMGFCYPGKGASGDLPPRPECAPLWHQRLLENLPDISLTLLVGRYAQNYYLESPGKTLTQTVHQYKRYLPHFLPLPHPSPRNFIWQNKNPWFQDQLLPQLQQRVRALL